MRAGELLRFHVPVCEDRKGPNPEPGRAGNCTQEHYHQGL